jgi:hypothetical protein
VINMKKTIALQREWLLELDRIGTAEGLEGFPMRPDMFVGENCWPADFEEGLTPRESIDGERPDASPELLRAEAPRGSTSGGDAEQGFRPDYCKNML